MKISAPEIDPETGKSRRSDVPRDRRTGTSPKDIRKPFVKGVGAITAAMAVSFREEKLSLRRRVAPTADSPGSGAPAASAQPAAND